MSSSSTRGLVVVTRARMGRERGRSWRLEGGAGMRGWWGSAIYDSEDGKGWELSGGQVGKRFWDKDGGRGAETWERKLSGWWAAASGRWVFAGVPMPIQIAD